MKKTGIVTALQSEAACLTAAAIPPGKPVEIAPGVLLVLSGMGQFRARQAAERLVDAKADALISFGVAGGLAREIRPGELCIPEKIITADFSELHTDPDRHEDMLALLQNAPVKLHTAPLFSGNEIVRSTNAKALINKQTQAIAIDMESTAIVEAARAAQLPGLVVRAIVDSVGTQLSTSVLRHTDHFGRVRLLPMLGTLLAQPAQILPLIKLSACFKAATTTLQWTARQLLPSQRGRSAA